MKNPNVPGESLDGRTMLERIFSTPNLEQVVPRLQPELLHRVIQSCGLEECGELVVLATAKQLTRIFDLDLWRSGQPGANDQFDVERFGFWLELLAGVGASVAAQKLTEMDAALVSAGLAQHTRVFDRSAVNPYRSTDGIEMRPMPTLDDIRVGYRRLPARRVAHGRLGSDQANPHRARRRTPRLFPSSDARLPRALERRPRGR